MTPFETESMKNGTCSEEIELRYYSQEQYGEVLKKLDGYYRLQPILSSIKIAQNGCFKEEVDQIIASFSSHSTTYWICLKQFIPSRTQCYIGCQGVSEAGAFERGFRLFLKNTEAFKRSLEWKQILLWGEENVIFEAEKVVAEYGFSYAGGNPTWHNVDRNPVPTTSLSEGYVMDDMREEDVDIVAETWVHKMKNEQAYIRIRMLNLPCKVVRKNGKAAAWAMTEHNGMIIHLFVLPEHRRRGLKDAVMNQISYELKEKIGCHPYYCVVTSNEAMIRLVPSAHAVPNEETASTKVWFRNYRISGNDE